MGAIITITNKRQALSGHQGQKMLTSLFKQLADFNIIRVSNQAQFINSWQRTAVEVQSWLGICPLWQSRLYLFTAQTA